MSRLKVKDKRCFSAMVLHKLYGLVCNLVQLLEVLMNLCNFLQLMEQFMLLLLVPA
jgi:hypothetical protein